MCSLKMTVILEKVICLEIRLASRENDFQTYLFVVNFCVGCHFLKRRFFLCVGGKFLGQFWTIIELLVLLAKNSVEGQNCCPRIQGNKLQKIEVIDFLERKRESVLCVDLYHSYKPLLFRIENFQPFFRSDETVNNPLRIGSFTG